MSWFDRGSGSLPAWTREPLFHFLAAGALIYALLSWGDQSVDPADRVIAVDREQQAALSLRFERIMGRAPTDAELDAQIDDYVRDEVLYREALRLGLDQGDAIVRRRLVTKMDMAASAAAEAIKPDKAVLRAFFEENRDRYGGATAHSFDQVFFEKRDDAALAAQRLAADPGDAMRGDPISLPPDMEQASSRTIRDLFGEQFLKALSGLEPGDTWQGPVQSGFGWHLVRLRERSLQEADFEALRTRIENDWRSAEIDARKDKAFEVLRDAYRIEIDR